MNQFNQVEIPEKLYFSIGDVCRLLNLEPHVLRFWEKEFPVLSPSKGANGRRMYRRRDVEMAIVIKKLLYEQGFTIAGARKALAEKKASALAVSPSPAGNAPPQAALSAPTRPSGADPDVFKQLKSDLRSILTILNRRC
jgi:DNA-binding transcriptional MerR regulator